MLFVFSALLLLLSSTVTSALASESHLTRTVHREDDPSLTTIASVDKFFGHGTWYTPGLGACGSHATGTDYIVALNKEQYNSTMCHKHIRIINTMNGKSVWAEIQDECPGCAYGGIDMSPVVFTAIARSGLGEGNLAITWSFSSSSHPHSHLHLSSHHSPHHHTHPHTLSHPHPHPHHQSHHHHPHSHFHPHPHHRHDHRHFHTHSHKHNKHDKYKQRRRQRHDPRASVSLGQLKRRVTELGTTSTVSRFLPDAVPEI